MRFQTNHSKSYGNPLFTQGQRIPWIVRHPRWAIAVLCLGIAGALYVLYGLPSWRITTLTVQGTYTLSTDELRELTLRQMQGRWLLFFRQHSLFAFDTSAFERRLRERWIFSALTIDRTLPGTIALTLTEEKPAFIYSQGAEQFGVNRLGVLSTMVTEMAKDIPTIVLPAETQTPVLGNAVLTREDAEFFAAWKAALAERNVPTLVLREIRLATLPDKTAQLRVAGEWQIMTDRTQDVQKQIEAFFMAYEQKLQGRALEYVDVTVPARVYYK